MLACTVLASDLKNNLELISDKDPFLFLGGKSTNVIEGGLEEVSHINVNRLAPCQFATKAAFFNLAGI